MVLRYATYVTFWFSILLNMAIVGRLLLEFPCFVLSLYGVDPFTLKKVPLKCVTTLVFQFLLVLSGIVSLRDFQSVDPDLWVTCTSASQVCIYCSLQYTF